MDMTVRPSRFSGTFRAPDSKSDLHRKLICAFLSNDLRIHDHCTDDILSRIQQPVCDDILATIQGLRSLSDGYDMAVVECGDSGTTLRFLLPVAAALDRNVLFRMSGRLGQRPVEPLLEQLASHGCTVQYDAGDRAHGDSTSMILHISGQLTCGDFVLPGNISSQFISGLLLAMPLLKNDSTLRLTSPLESSLYVDMTLKVLREFGVTVRTEHRGTELFHIPGGQSFTMPDDMNIEGDWSGAAFFLAAGTAGDRAQSGTHVSCMGLSDDSLQPDRFIMNFIREMPPCVDISRFPDLVPVLAVLAAGHKGICRLDNGARLRFKESDRISSVAEMINGLGGKAEISADSIIIYGTESLTGGEVFSYNDHRIAMAAAVASAFSTGDIIIHDAQCVNKSYPGFWDDFRRLGGNYVI
ncbi:MAG: 3-phosphoshikimate 1-carboxyvinyltransferase [Spirochaetia bacterium]|nr:3-phosphoshikimate 1-carboxyvinyltransferase [Spirochaetia bacterium]